MTQPCIQGLLRAGWTPEKLLVKYGINYHVGATHPDLYSFLYDSTAPLASPVPRECCGLILDAAQNWDVVARPFDAFFGYGTLYAKPLDWSGVRVEDWLDGTLCLLYFYGGDWQVATKNSPDASLPVGELSDRPVRELFWEVWKREKFELPKVAYSHMTFLFELTGPENQNVVRYKNPHLTLIGMRHRAGQEVKPDIQDLYPFAVSLRAQTIPDVLRLLHNRRALDCKGVIVTNRRYGRNKFHHPQYRALKAGKVRWNLKQWLDLVTWQEKDDVTKYFPEDRRLIVTLTEAVSRLEREIDAAYWLLKDIPQQKEFAEKVTGLPYEGVLFALRNGHIANARQGLRAMPPDKLLRLANLKKESFYAIRGITDDAVDTTAAVTETPEIKDSPRGGFNDSLGG